MWCHPDEPEDKVMGWQEPCKVQQEMKSPAPREEHLQAPGHAGCHPAGKDLCRKGPGNPGEHKVENESVMCPGNKED